MHVLGFRKRPAGPHSCPVLPWDVASNMERVRGSDESVDRYLPEMCMVDAPMRSAANNRSTCGDRSRRGFRVTMIGRVGCARPRCRVEGWVQGGGWRDGQCPFSGGRLGGLCGSSW